MLVSWPIFIFPVFVILFTLAVSVGKQDLFYVVAASLIFDFFSGFRFGMFTLTILAVLLSIHLFKNQISVSPGPSFSTFFYSLIFVFIFFAILSFSAIGPVVKFYRVLLVEAVIIYIFFMIFIRTVSHDPQ